MITRRLFTTLLSALVLTGWKRGSSQTFYLLDGSGNILTDDFGARLTSG